MLGRRRAEVCEKFRRSLYATYTAVRMAPLWRGAQRMNRASTAARAIHPGLTLPRTHVPYA